MRGRPWLVTAVVAALAVGVVLVPHPWEGPVLLRITENHGIHVTDVIGLAVAVAVLGWVWRPSRR